MIKNITLRDNSGDSLYPRTTTALVDGLNTTLSNKISVGANTDVKTNFSLFATAGDSLVNTKAYLEIGASSPVLASVKNLDGIAASTAIISASATNKTIKLRAWEKDLEATEVLIGTADVTLNKMGSSNSSITTKQYVDGQVATKTTVSCSATGTTTNEIKYLTVDGTEFKLAGSEASTYTAGTGINISTDDVLSVDSTVVRLGASHTGSLDIMAGDASQNSKLSLEYNKGSFVYSQSNFTNTVGANNSGSFLVAKNATDELSVGAYSDGTFKVSSYIIGTSTLNNEIALSKTDATLHTMGTNEKSIATKSYVDNRIIPNVTEAPTVILNKLQIGNTVYSITGGSGGSYVAGDGIIIDSDNKISVNKSTIQAKLTAGDNITIDENNIISASVTNEKLMYIINNLSLEKLQLLKTFLDDLEKE